MFVRSIKKIYLEEIKRDGDENCKIDLVKEMGCGSRICIEV
jgi:hypothetical protein